MTRLLLAICVLSAALALAGTWDNADALIDEAQRKEEYAAIAGAAARDALAPPQLSHPIAYKAIVCQSDFGKEPRCRLYTGRK